jgi:hypothetical protein
MMDGARREERGGTDKSLAEGAEGGLPDITRDMWAAADERAATGMRDDDERS